MCKVSFTLSWIGLLALSSTQTNTKGERDSECDCFQKTDAHRYLHFNFHHPVSAKRAAVKSLFDRARSVTLQKEDLQKEEEHLTATFKQNGYPIPFIHATSSSIQEPSTPPEEEEPDDEESQKEEEKKQPLAVISYVGGVSEQIRKI